MKTSFPKDRIRAVLLEGVHDAGAELLAAEGFQVERLAGSPTPAQLTDLLSAAHLVGIRSKTQLRLEHLGAAPRLLAVGCFCIGTDQVDLKRARTLGLPVFNSPFGNTRSVAELTIAEVVMLCRRAFEKSAMMHAGGWDKSASGAHEVRGRTIGIVGYGHIGSQVSVLAEAMGMRVLYHDLVPKLALGNARQVGSLDELLAGADILTLHVPATAQTKGMIGREQLARMRPGALLINNARGNVVDLGAVRDSIARGHLSGGAFDVFPVEPRDGGEPFESELRGLPNVILTPHIGGSTVEAQETIARDVASKLIKFVNVGSTTGAVNVPQVELPLQDEGARPGAGPGGAPERSHRVLHFHQNVPGVLGKINSAMASQGVNVRAQYLRTDETIGYVVLDVDPSASDAALESLDSIEETIRTRVLW
ncbi:MAG TPA: phosphoglycerate dehydrogenase [Phycisphaerales bacterium]|nr:phosphoglycerate dehydrogenase [Phycisphaerales bacterium]